MHTAVPVETAVEDGVQSAWRVNVSRFGQHVIELIGILTGDVAERDLPELLRKPFSQYQGARHGISA